MVYLYHGTGELDKKADIYTDPVGYCSFKISLFLFGVVGLDYFWFNARFWSD